MDRHCRVLIGFDGFVDTLLFCVQKRLNPSSFQRLATIPQFAKKALEASGKSANIECVVKELSLGGNGPLLARCLASLGHKAVLCGTMGYPSLHPLFVPLKKLGLTLHSFAEPGQTKALEFTDGKLMLGMMGELQSLTLPEAMERIGNKLLPSLIEQAEFLVTANWTMMPLVGEFWDYLLHRSQLLQTGPKKSLFVDLADPAKRPINDLKKGLRTLSALNSACSVIVGLNCSESLQVLSALRLSTPSSLQQRAEKIASALRLSTVVIHTRQEVACTSLSEGTLSSHAFPVHVVKQPVRSTGAGDTFNAGFIAGWLRKEPPLACLKAAVRASGILIRTGLPPTAAQVFTK